MEKRRNNRYIRWLESVGREDVAQVGGKNASLGEMLRNLVPLGIRVPQGFATTADAYREFIGANSLEPVIRRQLERYHSGDLTLAEAARAIRSEIAAGIFPTPMAVALREAYERLSVDCDTLNVDVAVRSSATAEDLPEASFAGLQETYLNISGTDHLLSVCKKCFASLFTDRAIAYRDEMDFGHLEVALSVGVQKMVRADRSGSGVVFTVDTDTGFPNLVLINAGWGLGELVVKGLINPDQYLVFKPLLEREDCVPILEKRAGSKKLKMVYATGDGEKTRTVSTTPREQHTLVLDDGEILTLARWAARIEEHYGQAMDIEWVKEDETGHLYIVQARPETVHARDIHTFRRYRMEEPAEEPLARGLSIGSAVAHGRVCKVRHISEMPEDVSGCILVTQMTEPDWVPAMKNVAGIVTEFGGRTCHAAIVSRELGIPAIVGSHDAARNLEDGEKITLSCAGGEEGRVYPGWLDFEINEVELDRLPAVKPDLMLNLATPDSAFQWWPLPVKGVGLARMEFIISNHIRIHPMALVHFDRIEDDKEREEIRRLTRHWKDRTDYFVERLAEGVARIAASQYPRPVILRTSDFKTNEYAGLLGGSAFEPEEDNPMLGWRGASRYYSEGYREGFALECRAIRRVREEMGLDNLRVMIPFCRTLQEAEKVLQEMETNGLVRGERGLEIWMMCEVPSNYILIEEFARYFDGFSIGSNDLTQLILGVDRDSTSLAPLFDESDPAVRKAVREIVERAHHAGSRVSFCGQAPSDNPEYAAFLAECGIDSISLNPDSVVDVIGHLSDFAATQSPSHGGHSHP